MRDARLGNVTIKTLFMQKIFVVNATKRDVMIYELRIKI